MRIMRIHTHSRRGWFQKPLKNYPPLSLSRE
nr:MAG TPA: hypothetical protein [Caudoviricetes sp.]